MKKSDTQFMLREHSGVTQKGPNGGLRGDRETEIKAWRGQLGGGLRNGEPVLLSQATLAQCPGSLYPWHSGLSRVQGQGGGPPFCSSPPHFPVMSRQGWGLQSPAPDCLGCNWLGPSGSHVLSALCLPFLFRSLTLHLHPGSQLLSCSP